MANNDSNTKRVRGGRHLPGAAYLPEYRIWADIVYRCHTPTSASYKRYGARGIAVCDRWRFGDETRSGFECFIADMGRRPDGLTLDREDNNKGYSPDNCRWISFLAQQNNRRDNRRIEAHGRTQNLSEWVRETGLNHKTISDRLRLGWTPEQALEFAPRPSGPGRRPSRARLK